jgi:hypothetical protein
VDYPIYVVTDLITKVPDDSPFHVIRANFSMSGHFRKSEIAHYLPNGFDSYLILDVDTTVLGDLSFGFEKAESHGIAMVHSPTYLLERFNDFPTVMESEGLPFRHQPLFNSGVIFLKLSSQVSRVLAEWEAACRRWADKPVRKTDQPFLTLALEKVGVAPYTLVRNFNFRPRFDPFFGSIIVWHALLPAPSDLNDDPSTWRSIDLSSGRIRPFRPAWSYHRFHRSASKMLRSGFRRLVKTIPRRRASTG